MPNRHFFFFEITDRNIIDVKRANGLQKLAIDILGRAGEPHITKIHLRINYPN